MREQYTADYEFRPNSLTPQRKKLLRDAGFVTYVVRTHLNRAMRVVSLFVPYFNRQNDHNVSIYDESAKLEVRGKTRLPELCCGLSFLLKHHKTKKIGKARIKHITDNLGLDFDKYLAIDVGGAGGNMDLLVASGSQDGGSITVESGTGNSKSGGNIKITSTKSTDTVSLPGEVPVRSTDNFGKVSCGALVIGSGANVGSGSTTGSVVETGTGNPKSGGNIEIASAKSTDTVSLSGEESVTSADDFGELSSGAFVIGSGANVGSASTTISICKESCSSSAGQAGSINVAVGSSNNGYDGMVSLKSGVSTGCNGSNFDSGSQEVGSITVKSVTWKSKRIMGTKEKRTNPSVKKTRPMIPATTTRKSVRARTKTKKYYD